MNGNRPKQSKYSWLVIATTIAVVIILGIIIILSIRSHRSPGKMTGPGKGSTAYTEPQKTFPDIKDKPEPRFAGFRDCPPEGDGGDPQLNRLKNRVDDGNYIPVEFDAIVGLPWPRAIERRHRDRWSEGDKKDVARYEGVPVSVVGYLAGAKQEGPESCNCHGADKEYRDYHVWLTKSAGEDRIRSIVVEVTPPIHQKHPGWDIKVLKKIVRNKQKVRISGWIMLDPEHPDQVGKTRGTIWEIHPIMQIEVESDGRWMPLDNIASGDTLKGGENA
ncbi:MAG: hypothetical protein ACM3S2_10120 [Ignavibacteriales bacterium]